MASNLSLKQIRAVVAVAREGNIQVAAQRLNVSPSVVSRALAGAENVAGTPLFQRGWNGVELTVAGEIALQHCSAALRCIARATDEIASAGGARPRLQTHLRLNDLKALVSTVKCGSASAAARELGVSQPAVSRALKTLADCTRQPLFRRSGKGLAGLPAARTLARLHHDLTTILEPLPNLVRSRHGDVHGRLAVGLLPFSGQDMVAKAFGILTDQQPGLQLSAIPGSYELLTDALMREEIDCILGILRNPPRFPEMVEKKLYTEKYALVARRDHLCHDTAHSMADLKNEKWIVGQHGTPIRDYFETLFAREGETPPTQTCQIHSFHQAELVIINSSGIGLLAYGDSQLGNLNPQLRKLDIELPNARVDIGIASLRRNAAAATLTLFEQTMRNLLAREARQSRD